MYIKYAYAKHSVEKYLYKIINQQRYIAYLNSFLPMIMTMKLLQKFDEQ